MLNVNFKCCTVSLIAFPALTFTVFPSQKISFMCLGEAGLKQHRSFLSQIDFSTGQPGCKWMMPRQSLSPAQPDGILKCSEGQLSYPGTSNY